MAEKAGAASSADTGSSFRLAVQLTGLVAVVGVITNNQHFPQKVKQ